MSVRTRWILTPDEFAWIWRETGSDELPYPIAIRETPRTKDEYAAMRADLSERYPPFGDPDLSGPLRVIADPDLRLVSTGRITNSPRRIRSVAAASGELGVVLFQLSGRSAEFGSDLHLVVTRRADLGKHVAATMPTTPPGSIDTMVAYTPRVRGQEPPSSWLRTESGQSQPEERIRRFLRLPRAAEGHFRIDLNPRAERPHPPSYLYWVDIHDGSRAAGRYLIDVAYDTTVTPASREVIAAELARRAELVN